MKNSSSVLLKCPNIAATARVIPLSRKKFTDLDQELLEFLPEVAKCIADKYLGRIPVKPEEG